MFGLTEVEVRKSGEAEGVWNRAFNLRAAKVQRRKTGEAAEGVRDRARQTCRIWLPKK